MCTSIKLDSRPATDRAEVLRLKGFVRGAVQGVGFRPFVYRLAKELELTGWVSNSSQGVSLEVEGPLAALDKFQQRLRSELPPRSFIQSYESRILDPAGFAAFEIRLSDDRGEKSAVVLPDIAVCADCAREVLDPGDRRYLYPFTNCTNCGPRYSIIESLPYDRPNTSMKKFRMCPECEAEYGDPENRRFHAQPNACPKCGPKVALWDGEGKVLGEKGKALKAAARALLAGKIVAVKGLGGFHLMADARSDEAVRRLRHRKHREEKPLALMVRGVKSVKRICTVSKQELAALKSAEAPIVILKKRPGSEEISELVAPGNPNLGVMLPYTPLHSLILRRCRVPLVATSGNLSDEPICIDEHEALSRLRDIADLFLVHDRPIVRHVDDSIVRMMAGRETVLRRARGFAPLPVLADEGLPAMIAVGAHLKSSVAGSNRETGAVVSQHIGDLDTEPARNAFSEAVEDLEDLYGIEPSFIACDSHPDYFSTSFAVSRGLPVRPIQHHYAHVLSCMAENELKGAVTGVAWDGTGYGTDGTIWGGEFLAVGEDGFERFAHLRQFKLPGGDTAVREPRRSALGVLYEIFGESAFDLSDLETLKAFPSEEVTVVGKMLSKKINSPVTSSAGRLFDAVASIIGKRQFLRFEGQAAMDLEFLTDGIFSDEAYPHGVPEKKTNGPAIVDWEPLIRGVIRDRQVDAPLSLIAVRFHNTLVEMIVEVAKLAGEERVALSGGCFQNKYLLERAVSRLEEEGFKAYRHQRVPPNDGGISLGQIWGAARMWREA
jgi:hydrogenase maturation protein HypF